MKRWTNILQTAQGTELKTLVERSRDLLEKNYQKILEGYGVKGDTPELAPLEELIAFAYLATDDDRDQFEDRRQRLWGMIFTEVRALQQATVQKGAKKSSRSKNLLTESTPAATYPSEPLTEKPIPVELWIEAHRQFIDRLVFTFLNRIFATRIMESLELLREATFVPQPELGNRSARMAKIQEHYPGKSVEEWHILVIQDVFDEISEDVKVIFETSDITTRIWPEGDAIIALIQILNAVNPEIYLAEDCIGWFYHYYVLKDRKGHKTMSSHGSKSPANPHYLSVLNTVYTPRWMVQILVDNSLGHWWQDLHPTSTIFASSPFFIQKQPVKLPYPTDTLEEMRLLDPACGSGNFLVYTFSKLVDMYREAYPSWDYPRILTTILTQNLYGIDINRRPAQLSALALFILAKKILKDKAPAELQAFHMPPVNIISCDIRIPADKNRMLFIQRFKQPKLQKIMLDVFDQFDNADQLGSLIDIRSLQAELEGLRKELNLTSKKGKLDAYAPKLTANKTGEEIPVNLVEFIDQELLAADAQNVGLQLFGHQAKTAASLAQLLMNKYDVIMGNPPFGLSLDVTKDKLRKFYPNTYADLISAFVDQGLRILKENGFISMVSDFSFMHLPKFEDFRRETLILKSTIQYMFLVGEGALPNAANKPNLFILRKTYNNKNSGLYRYVNVRFFKDAPTPISAIHDINKWGENSPIPAGWNLISQQDFLSLPRSVIDLTLAEKFKPLLEFFTKYPRFDVEQISNNENRNLDKKILAKIFVGIQTGSNEIYGRYWFEPNVNQIRLITYKN